jgi:hypothetical protein
VTFASACALASAAACSWDMGSDEGDHECDDECADEMFEGADVGDVERNEAGIDKGLLD